MGFHKTSATRNMRQPQAHLDRRDNGDVYAVLKLNFKKKHVPTSEEIEKEKKEQAEKDKVKATSF